MPDEPNVAPASDAGTVPPAALPPALPTSELEPLKAKVSELERTLLETKAQNQQYQEYLGRVVAAQQTQTQLKPDTQPLESKFDEETRVFVQQTAEKAAERIAYGLVNRAQLAQELGQAPDLQREAQGQFNAINSNPFYASWNPEAKEALAVERAKVAVLQRARTGQQQADAKKLADAAAQAQAGNATLPGTSGSGQAAPSDKEEYIKQWMADPQNQDIFYRFHRIRALSPEGKDEFRKTAEAAAEGVMFGGAVGQALEILSGGNR